MGINLFISTGLISNLYLAYGNNEIPTNTQSENLFLSSEYQTIESGLKMLLIDIPVNLTPSGISLFSSFLF